MNNPTAPDKNISSEKNISVIGIGRLGICAALVMEKAGYNVIGVDVIPSYVDAINNKTLKSSEPLVEEYLSVCKNFKSTTNIDEALAFSDLIFVLVATPTGIGAKSYDHSTLSNVLCDIGKRRVKNKNIIIGCTVLPGYIRGTGRFLLRDCENTTLSYNPEFIAQGNIIRDFENPDMVLIGAENDAVAQQLETLYNTITHNTPRVCKMTAESAEITKLSINCFITTKIAFANTISDIAGRTPGANDSDILNAIGADTRIGSKCLKPGFGFGGPCFPRDNRALGNYANMIGINPIIPKATDESNKLHAELMAADMERNQRAPYVFEDVAYKPNCPVTIIEESQKLAVAQLLAQKGYRIIIKDRAEIIEAVMKEFGSMFDYELI